VRALLVSLVFSAFAFGLLRGLWPALRARRGALLFALVTAAVHAGFLLARQLEPGVLRPATQALLTAWFVAALVVVGIGGPLRLALWVRARLRRPVTGAVPAVDVGRRQVLGLALPATAATVSASGTVAAFTGFELRHEEVRLPGLPPALDGFRVGQLTDVHIGDFIDTGYLKRAVAALDEAGAHLQVMTGDLIDDLDELEPTMDALESTRAPLGMIAILGNHEKWRDEDRVVQAYARRAPRGRLRFLRDESLVVEHQGAPVRVVGVDYPMRKGGLPRPPRAERLGMMRASAEAGWAGVARDETVLCLTHHPDFFPFAAERGAALTLAGHTHGGQVGFFRMPLFFFAYQYMLGRYRRGRSHLYVGGGTGHWLPFRVGVPAEVTVLTLRRGHG
jgi:predicted MPP superfamily phosphohydrolase